MSSHSSSSLKDPPPPQAPPPPAQQNDDGASAAVPAISTDEENNTRGANSGNVIMQASALERNVITSMIFGTSNVTSLHEAEETMHRAVTGINEAMETVPAPEKAAYLEVCRVAPKLVNVESSPVRFLKFEQHNARAAATRLARYWKFRRQWFGADRAYLPMSQDGKGTLNESDVEMLQTGWLALLPSVHGRPVLCYDRSRSSKDFANFDSVLPARIRTCFYMLHVASLYPDVQELGFTGLSLINQSFTRDDLDMALVTPCYEFISQGMPLRQHSNHVVSRPPRAGRKEFVEKIFPSMLQFLGDHTHVVQNIYSHVGYSREKILKGLEEHGFVADGLPRSLGGKWNYFTEMADWRRERVLLEQAVCAALETAEAGQTNAPNLNSAVGLLREATEKKKKRNMDALYARRKRGKRKIEVEVLHEQVQALTTQRTGLLRTHQRLRGLLHQAADELARCGVSAADLGSLAVSHGSWHAWSASLSGSYDVVDGDDDDEDDEDEDEDAAHAMHPAGNPEWAGNLKPAAAARQPHGARAATAGTAAAETQLGQHPQPQHQQRRQQQHAQEGLLMLQHQGGDSHRVTLSSSSGPTDKAERFPAATTAAAAMAAASTAAEENPTITALLGQSSDPRQQVQEQARQDVQLLGSAFGGLNAQSILQLLQMGSSMPSSQQQLVQQEQRLQSQMQQVAFRQEYEARQQLETALLQGIAENSQRMQAVSQAMNDHDQSERQHQHDEKQRQEGVSRFLQGLVGSMMTTRDGGAGGGANAASTASNSDNGSQQQQQHRYAI